MKILVTNHHLYEYKGSEVSTLTLCKYLSKKGHDVYVYSKYFSNFFVEEFNKNKIKTINNLELIQNEKFDIGHIQQNICAYEVREKFPKLPLVMWIHGVIPYLEQPPFIDLNISMFLVNNNEGKEYIEKKFNIDSQKIFIIRNIVDSEQFLSTSPINKNPQNALIISNKITPEKELIIKKVLDKLSIKYKFVGQRFGTIQHSELPYYINKADIVFTVALGAMETMMCGRIPILFDYNYAPYDDGIVTPENFNLFKEYNFSGRATKQIFTEEKLYKEIKKYQSDNGEKLMSLAKQYYDANTKINILIDLYKKTIKEFKYKKIDKKNENLLFNLNQIIKITNQYTKHNCYISNEEKLIKNINNINQEKKQIEEKNEKLQQDLNKIQSSKTYKIWQKFNNIKKIILLPYRFGKYFLKSNLFFINFEIKKLFIKKTELKYLEEKFIIDGVSFIIPTWNKEEMVVNCVNNLMEKLEKEYKDIPKEIIVIDNGSADNTTKSIKNIKSTIPINVISLEKNIGFGPAVNLATEKSKYNYIYLLNNDMFPKDGFFSEIINFANNLIKNKKPFFGLSSQIFFYDQTKRREESGKTYITPKFGFINVAHCVNKSNLENNSITAYPGGGSSLINKYVFKEIGFYDYKSYTPLYCEDLDSGFITWKLGFPNYYIANSHVIHHHRSSSKNLSINPDFIMHKNWLTFILKNFNNKSLYFKHILSYSLLCCLDKKYREYSNEVFKNKNNILNSKLFLTKFKNKYKEKDLINFIDFEIKNEF